TAVRRDATPGRSNVVAASVPSDTHSPAWTPAVAAVVKYTRPPAAVRLAGFELRLLTRMFFRIDVPDALPSLRHSSVPPPAGVSPAGKSTVVPTADSVPPAGNSVRAGERGTVPSAV